MMLSKVEAVHFLRGVLQVPNSVSSKQPTLSFLNEIVKSYQNTIPWQCISNWALPPSQRHLPTWEGIKRNQFAKRGGTCYENNMMMKELLNTFNFDVGYTSVQVSAPNDHMTIMVRGLTSSVSRHWVDVGSTFPLFQAIPLDFETDSIEYNIGFLRQRFVKMSGTIEWHHERHHPPYDGCKQTNDGWYQFAQINADIPCDVNFFESPMTRWYTVEEGNLFFEAPRAIVYKNNKLIAIKGNELIKETPEKTVEKKRMENLDQLLHAYKTYFPQIAVDVVKDALNQTIFKI